MLPGASSRQLLSIAERVRAAIAAAPVRTDHGLVEVTTSIGAAERRADAAQSTAELLEIADQALLQAKATGRNRVVAAAGIARTAA